MNPRTRFPAFLSAFSLVAALSACGYGANDSYGASVAAPDATVIAWSMGATNVRTTVKAGAKVQWKSTDGMAHTVTSSSAPAAFAELGVPAGAFSVATTFDTPGTFPYFCSIHGAAVQNGVLTVTP